LAINLRSGVRLPVAKDDTHINDIIEIRPPELFSVPVVCTNGYPVTLTVKVGDKVKDGSLLAKPSQSKGVFVYSPTSGTVVSIIEKFTPTGMKCKHVVIKNDNMLTEHNFPEMPDKSPKELLKRLAISGIVDANFGGSPTYLRYTLNAIEKKFNLYVTMSNTDPYLTANECLTLNRTAEVVAGAKYFASLLASECIYFVFTSRAKLARKHLTQFLKKNEPKLKYKIKTISNNYPSDNINLLTEKFKESRNMFVESYGKKAFVEDAITCFSFFNSVEYGKPNNYRVITISGNNIIRKGNYLVKNGTTFQHVLEVVGVKKSDRPFKVLNGGIMMGLAEYSTDISCNLETLSVNFVDDTEFNDPKESPCINCGKCVAACPMNLLPNVLDEYCLRRKTFDAERYGIKSCIECGCCSYVCPARRYLAQRIGLVKRQIANRKGGKK